MSRDNKKIATLWDNKDSGHQNNEDESSQAFYAGGSEHSGQQILGPAAADRLFNHTLQSSALLNEPTPSGSSLPVVFWRNGFTVGDEAELREYDSQENRRFLECLKRGETPPELASRVRGGMIDVKLENKAHLDYKPQPRVQAFSGEGHRLGAPAPETVEHPTSSSDQQPSKLSEEKSNLKVDETKPVTTIQVRLLDNSRLIVRANLTNNVGDIVSHIRSVRPEYTDSNFALVTTFPARELTDLTQSVADAKLTNATVMQKLKH